MFKKILSTLVFIFGRRFCYRFGRSLYLYSRNDYDLDIRTNGESMVQYKLIEALNLESTLTKKLVIFDVGANVGDWSRSLLRNVNLLKRNVDIDLYMFEPVETTFETLKKNIGSGVGYHYVMRALSCSEGETAIYLNGSSDINSIYNFSNSETPKTLIQTTTATAFVDKIGCNHIHLLKIDAEGHDFNVILGALPLLVNQKITVLQFEYNHLWVFAKHFLKDVFDIIHDLPYILAKVTTSHLTIFNKWDPELEKFYNSNYVIVHRSALKYFETHQMHLTSDNILLPY